MNIPDVFQEVTAKTVKGKITKIHKDGWGFIISKEIPFTRVFFHWTGLKQDTVKFPELKTGMIVEFIPIEIPARGTRATKISIVSE